MIPYFSWTSVLIQTCTRVQKSVPNIVAGGKKRTKKENSFRELGAFHKTLL
jgi:hypothetical protein